MGMPDAGTLSEFSAGEDDRKMQRYVGFYWTLPVPFADFTSLPENVAEAAASSRTVRYQRERVWRWVKEENAELVAERAILELAPDRGTAVGAASVDSAIKAARKVGADLVLVDFAQGFGWRRHPALWEYLDAVAISYMALSPDPVMIDGKPFDPVAHFRTWEGAWTAFRATKPERKEAIRSAIGTLPIEEMTFADVADHLNEAGVKPLQAKTWNKELVRKFMKYA
ncbi:hypothetical protein R3X27_23390 [Tropicimonas sp. TH_r6]|uniref:hypothetical protein n=1 Tax=Tropicimonas sp. TH_r6 TaxID=3082085 RepID=UPI00295451B4|nr:hypothetical protein [Tropicimonas sp. TH_r6]MDV7145638.1 hypothetical protein [Tropicimonas sp. TH_r6]